MRRTLFSLCLFAAAPLWAQANLGPVTVPQLNNTYYVGSILYPTIQSAVTAGCAAGNVLVSIPYAFSGGGTIASLTGCTTVVLNDRRGVLDVFYYYSAGSYVVLNPGSLTVNGAITAGSLTVTGTVQGAVATMTGSGNSAFTGPITTSALTATGQVQGAVANFTGTGLSYFTGGVSIVGALYTYLNAGSAGFPSSGTTGSYSGIAWNGEAGLGEAALWSAYIGGDTASFWKNTSTGYVLEGHITGAGVYTTPTAGGVSAGTAGVSSTGPVSGTTGTFSGTVTAPSATINGHVVSNVPVMTWSPTGNCSTQYGNCIESSWVSWPYPVTLTSWNLAFGTTAPAGCTTLPTMLIVDITSSTTLATITMVNGTQYYVTSTFSPASLAANHQLLIKTGTAEVGCTTIPNNPYNAVTYTMQ